MSSSNTLVASLTSSNGGLVVYFPFNPNNATWNYQLNRQIYDTFGGRVVQLLSVQTGDLTIQGDAGTRPKLLALYAELKKLQDHETSSGLPSQLLIPLSYAEQGNISCSVFFSQFSLGVDTTTVTHPYQLVLKTQDSNFGTLKYSDSLGAQMQSRINSDINFAQNIGLSNTNGTFNGTYQGVNPTGSLSIAQMSQSLWNPPTGASPVNVINNDGSYNP